MKFGFPHRGFALTWLFCFGLVGCSSDAPTRPGPDHLDAGGTDTGPIADSGGTRDAAGTSCTPGEDESCYDGAPSTEGVGACRAGTRTCENNFEFGGRWGECSGAVFPAEEACGNGIDDDCDGVAEEGCVCSPGSTTSCYDGPTGTLDVGQCRAGTATCLPDGNAHGDCTGSVTPNAEACGNGFDEDCDTRTDEACTQCPSQTLTAPTSEPGVTCTDTFPVTPSGWEGFSPRMAGERCRGPACLIPGNTCGTTHYLGTVSGGSRGTCLNYCAVRARCNNDGTWTVLGFTW